jgi:hypothetical protein
MNMDQVDRMLAQPKIYYNIDGVGELSMGFTCLAFSLLGTMQLHAPKESPWHGMYLFVIYVGLMLAIVKYGSLAIKKHITYPRTGFVEYRKKGVISRFMIGGAVGGLTTVGAFIAVQRRWDLTMFSFLFGLFLAGGYFYGVARSARWKWVVGLAMAFVSVLVSTYPRIWFWVDDTWIGAYWFTFMLDGALMLISGAISFGLYLCHTQAPAQENQ